VSVVTRGFHGRGRSGGVKLPPGQYLEHGFPVLQAGPTPPVNTATASNRHPTHPSRPTRLNAKRLGAISARIWSKRHTMTELA
jgi:hypothetical protein